jgi:hypothetical protein
METFIMISLILSGLVVFHVAGKLIIGEMFWGWVVGAALYILFFPLTVPLTIIFAVGWVLRKIFHSLIPFLAWLSDLQCWKWKNFWKVLGVLIGCIPATFATIFVISESNRANGEFFKLMMVCTFFWLVTMSVLIRGLKSTPKS